MGAREPEGSRGGALRYTFHQTGAPVLAAPPCGPHALALPATSCQHQGCSQGRDGVPGSSLRRSSDATSPCRSPHDWCFGGHIEKSQPDMGASQGDQTRQQAGPRCSFHLVVLDGLRGLGAGGGSTEKAGKDDISVWKVGDNASSQHGEQSEGR